MNTLKSKQVMVDIETYGSRPGSVVASIGACTFELESDWIIDKFYINVDRVTSRDAGLVEDQATLTWWAKQSDAAKAKLVDPQPVEAKQAFKEFGTWLPHDPIIWSHGATFDIVLLAEAFHRLGYPTLPFKYWDARDTRTIFDLANFSPPKTREGTHHNALDDACNQARWVQQCYQSLMKGAK